LFDALDEITHVRGVAARDGITLAHVITPLRCRCDNGLNASLLTHVDKLKRTKPADELRAPLRPERLTLPRHSAPVLPKICTHASARYDKREKSVNSSRLGIDTKLLMIS
jgi:hypothetical protein